MRISELLRLVWMNISQNKFKSVLTSIGIVAGAATIVLVIGIGQGGQMEVAEQFAQLNAGAIDITYEYEGEEADSRSLSFGKGGQFFGNMFRGGDTSGERAGASGGFIPGGNVPGENAGTPGEFTPGENKAMRYGGQSGEDSSQTGGSRPEGGIRPDENTSGQEETPEAEEAEEEESSIIEERLNQEPLILEQDDVDDIERYVTGITGATISYSTKASVEGGTLQSAQTYTVAGVKDSFLDVSKLKMEEGEFLTQAEEDSREKVCILGASVAKELFDSARDALGSTVYIDDRTYSVVGVLQSSQTVSAGISPDTAIMIPYETGIKYITGTDISPVITVIARDVEVLEDVIEAVGTVLEERHVNARFTFEDSGSKMQAAQSSNRTLTMLLSAMAVIVFLVGGIGIMNVLFVSVKERTNEIGILKAIGTSKGDILTEFLIEAAAVSLMGGILGVAVSFLVIPVAQYLNVRVEVGISACMAALGFAVLTGTVFGIYPAWKASRLEPVDALNAE